MPSRTIEDVELWKKAHAWVLTIDRFTEGFPRHEMFGLSIQLRRSAVAVPAKFAEGFWRATHRDKSHYYNIAQTSLEESRYYLILTRDLGYGETESLIQTAEEVSRMLTGHIRALPPDS